MWNQTISPKPQKFSTRVHARQNCTLHTKSKLIIKSLHLILIKPTKLTFLQPFSFPSFLSFLSKQQAPMLRCEECTAVWAAVSYSVCVSLSTVKRTKPWLTLMLENTTAPVTHTRLQGLTRLYLTPCVCGAMTDCVCARERLLSHMHSLMGVAPPLASYPSCLLFATSAARSLNSEVYTVNIVLIILMNTSCFDEHSGFP